MLIQHLSLEKRSIVVTYCPHTVKSSHSSRSRVVLPTVHITSVILSGNDHVCYTCKGAPLFKTPSLIRSAFKE